MPADENDNRSMPGHPMGLRPDLRRSVRIITVAGCLAMVFMHLTTGAHRVAFLKDLGARPFHFSVIGAVPPLLLSLQFLAALFVNRLRHRKRIWIVVLVIRRSLVCLLGFLPWLFPNASPRFLVWAFIGILAVGQAMGTCCAPVFVAWMGALLPRDSFSEIWGGRRLWLSWSRAGVMLALSGTLWLLQDVNIRTVFPVVACVGALAGVMDILLFVKVPEPPAPVSDAPHFERLLEPFKQKRFRRYILYDSVLRFGMLLSAPLVRIFLLQEIGLGVHLILLLFTCHALGGTLFARRIGRLADRVGHRPIIILATALKCVVTLAMFLLQPGPMVLLLVPVFLFDNMLNTAIMVSRTGFTLKQAPEKNRAMFVAAVLATAGLAGALGSMAGGFMMDHLPALNWSVGAWTLTRFRVVFAVSALFRFAGFLMATRLHEPESTEAAVVWRDVVRPALQRPLEAPILFLRNLMSNSDDEID